MSSLWEWRRACALASLTDRTDRWIKPQRTLLPIPVQERRSRSLMTPMRSGGGGKSVRRSDSSLQTSSFESGLGNACTE